MTWIPIDDKERPAPRDGTWVDVKSIDGGVFRMYWWPEGTSWTSADLVQTGVWTDEDGWLQPDEATHWRLPPPPEEGDK